MRAGVAQHHVSLRHAVGNRGAGGKEHAAAGHLVLNALGLDDHADRALRRGPGGQVLHALHAGDDRRVLVAVCLIDQQGIDPEILPRHADVLAAGERVEDLLAGVLQTDLGFLQGGDGAGVRGVGKRAGVFEFLHLLVDVAVHHVWMVTDEVELAVSHENRVMVAGGDTGDELPALGTGKGFLVGDQHARIRVSSAEGCGKLGERGVLHDDHRPVGFTEALQLHGQRDERVGFPETDAVRDHAAALVDHAGDGRATDAGAEHLIRCTGQGDVFALERWRLDAVCLFVERLHDDFLHAGAVHFRVRGFRPALEFHLELVELGLGDLGGGRIEDQLAIRAAAFVVAHTRDGHGQRVLDEFHGGNVRGAEFVGVAKTGDRPRVCSDRVSRASFGQPEAFHEGCHYFGRQPWGIHRHADLCDSFALWQCSLERGDVAAVCRIIFGGGFRFIELPLHESGQVGIADDQIPGGGIVKDQL